MAQKGQRYSGKPKKSLVIDGEAEPVANSDEGTAETAHVPDAEPVGFDAESPTAAGGVDQSDVSGADASDDASPRFGQDSSKSNDMSDGSARASETMTSPPQAQASSGGGFLKGGVAGAVAGAVVAFGLSMSGLGGGSGTEEASTNVQVPAELESRIAALESAPGISGSGDGEIAATLESLRSSLDEATARLEALEAAPGGEAADGSPALDALQAQIETLRADLASRSGDADVAQPALTELSERLAAAESAIAALPAAADLPDLPDMGVVSQLQETVGQLQAELGGLDDTIGALAARLAAAEEGLTATKAAISEAETRLSSIAEDVAESDSGTTLAGVVAATALKSAIDRGGSFTAELETFAALGIAPDAVTALRDYAASGVATREALENGFADVAFAMADALRETPEPTDMIGRLMSSAQSLVRVRPVDAEVTDGPARIIAEMEEAVRRGDFAAVVDLHGTLPEAAQAAGAGYIAAVRSRLETDRLIAQSLAAAGGAQ